MKDNSNWFFNALSVVTSAIQTNEVMQAISFILTILSVLVSLAYTIYKWYHKAKEDNKIDEEEVEDLKNQVKDIIEEEKEKLK